MTCKKIDMDTYPRLGHFKHFLTMANPFLSVTVQVDLSEWLPRIKKSGLPFFLSFQYALVRTANRIPEFRQRIVGEAIVEYDYCDPSYTYGLPDGTYRYCSANTGQPLAQYLKEARGSEEEALREEHLTEHEDVLRYLFISCNPWFTYTGLTMPWPDTALSNPNFVWGGYQVHKELCLQDGQIVELEKISLPVTVFANHALVDGINIGRFFSFLDEELKNFPFEE